MTVTQAEHITTFAEAYLSQFEGPREHNNITLAGLQSIRDMLADPALAPPVLEMFGM